MDHKRSNRNDLQRRSLGKGFILSVVFHTLLLVLVVWLFKKGLQNRKENALSVWLMPKELPKETQKPKEKVVVFLAPKPSKRPEEAHYFSRQDSFAKKETSAKKTSLPIKNSKPSLAQKEEEEEKSVARFFKKKPQKALNSEEGEGEHFEDFVADLDEGNKTDLKAWAFRHAPFFERVKARIGSIWSPGQQIRRFDPQGVLLGHKHRITVMSVTIDPEGSLIFLSLHKSSGVAYLDEEAERAIKMAAPFLFPPKELFEKDGKFSFSFAFHLTVDRGISLNFEWQS